MHDEQKLRGRLSYACMSLPEVSLNTTCTGLNVKRLYIDQTRTCKPNPKLLSCNCHHPVTIFTGY
jgi:hypothetical protein